MNEQHIIDIPVEEFNCYPKFVHNIIIYNFNVRILRENRYDTEKLVFDKVLYNTNTKLFSVKLRYVTERGSELITYNRFAQFINGQFNLDVIIDKYDTRNKIVYSKEFLEYKPEMFTNSNVVVIKMIDNHKDMDGNDKPINSLTKGNYYLAFKCHDNDKYKLLTLNNFERKADSAIYVTMDFRFNEYAIKRWEFTKNECYPIIQQTISGRVSAKVDTIFYANLKYGDIKRVLNENIEFSKSDEFSKSVEFTICSNDSYDSVKYKLKKWTKYKYNTEYGRILQHTGPCNEIPLTATSNLNSNVIPGISLMESPDLFIDRNYEFDPNEFLLNHKVNVVKKDIDLSLGMGDEFLSLL